MWSCTKLGSNCRAQVELAPFQIIFGLLKSDFGVFCPFRAIFDICVKFSNCDIFLGPKDPIQELHIQKWHPKSSHLAKTESFLIFVEQKMASGFMWFELRSRHDSCQKFYTTGFSGQKFCTLNFIEFRQFWW